MLHISKEANGGQDQRADARRAGPPDAFRMGRARGRRWTAALGDSSARDKDPRLDLAITGSDAKWEIYKRGDPSAFSPARRKKIPPNSGNLYRPVRTPPSAELEPGHHGQLIRSNSSYPGPNEAT